MDIIHDHDNTIASLVTSPAVLSDWSDISVRTFDPNYPIASFILAPGKTYGPFYKVGGENIDWFFQGIPEERNIAGFKKPTSKKEARKWYKPLRKNPLSHIHKFYIRVPVGVTNAGGLIGKVKKGTEFQVIFNNVAAQEKHIVKRTCRKMPNSSND